MPNDEVWSEDWLDDPLVKIGSGSYKSLKLKNTNGEQNDRWRSFHFATRLKLDGADYFCRQALGAASMPDDLGLPLLAHRQTEWNLDAFFFELMAAFDTVLQELNIVYAYDLGLKPEGVRWSDKNKNKFMGKLPEEIFNRIEEERKKVWFYEVQSFRNTATHHYTVPLSSVHAGFGEEPLDFTQHKVSIHCAGKAGTWKSSYIEVCIDYLKNMVRYISSVWEKMAQEFE